tara:strand:- start:875 stop:3511 length:2637 start_codon:yes stop_codon:yes gene_type:complete
MKNKKILTFLFAIFCLLPIKTVFGEEIIFETPEIEVFENGNILKAYKGGKAVIDNSTEIIADKFEYNKKTKTLLAEGNAQGIDLLNKVTINADKLFFNKITFIYNAEGNSKVIDKIKKISIEADELEYNKKDSKYIANKNVKVDDNSNNVITEAEKMIYIRNEEKIFTEGKTKIFIEKIYKINSKDVVWLRNKKEFSSEKFTTFEDTENNFYTAEKFRFLSDKKLLRGKKVTLESNNDDKYSFDDVFVNVETGEMHGKDLNVSFKKSTFGNIDNDPRLKGNKAYSDRNVTTVSKGAFTTCKKRPNEKCPPWIIEAKEARHDKNKKTIYYKNAWLKIYDVPVLYYPYFFHPDPTVKRQSGFLTPQIGESQTLGSSAYIPYFYVISDKKDLTLKPRIFTDNKFSIQTEYRQVSKKMNHIFDFSLTQGHDSSENDQNDARSHFFSNSIIDLDMPVFDLSNLEIQLQKTSNNTYLKLFDLESPLFGNEGSSGGVSTLNSFINLTANKEDLDLDASVEVYEKLEKSNSDRYEFILPSYNLNKNIKKYDKLDGTLTFSSSGSQHIYDTNIFEAQIINDLLYNSEDKYLSSGIKNNYNILLKNVNSDGRNSEKISNDPKAELLSTFIFESSYPLLREGINFNNYLTPKISLRYSPTEMKNLNDEDRRININNIFSLDRIGFADTIESGQSLTIGTEYKKTRKEEKNNTSKDVLEFSLATVFRDEINEDIPASSSLGNRSSDIFGHIGVEPNNFFNSSYNFTVDNNIDQFKYHDVTANFKVNNFVTSFKYIEEKDNIGNENYLQNITSYKFDENNSISFATRKNKKIDLTEYYDLIYRYQNDCLTAAISYNKEYYADGDLKPTEQLFFSLTIVPLGSYETKNILPK